MGRNLDKFLICFVWIVAACLYGPTMLKDHKTTDANRVTAESDTEIQYMSEDVTYEQGACDESLTNEETTNESTTEEIIDVVIEESAMEEVAIKESTIEETTIEETTIEEIVPKFMQVKQEVPVVKTLFLDKRDARLVCSDAMAMIKSVPVEVKPSMITVTEQAKADAVRENATAFSKQISNYYEEKAKENARNASTVQTVQYQSPTGDGVLTASKGVNYGPSGKETYYNLDMSGVVQNAQNMGIEGEYWVREDGVKMYGDYVMVAANLETHPRGSIVESSLGKAIVVDTGGFAASDPNQLDIATAW